VKTSKNKNFRENKCFFTAVSSDFMNFLEKQSKTTRITTILAKNGENGPGPV